MSHKKPQHIAIIMDGNGRWATEQGLPRIQGHQQGVQAVREAVETCASHQIPVLSLFAFSSENWQRPASEVEQLMTLFLTALQDEVESLHENNIRLRFIGDLSPFSQALVASIEQAQALTQDNPGLQLVVNVNYGGRWDILEAVKRLLATDNIQPEQITEQALNQYLSIADLPEPDLFIRTSGEQRISNFYLWQLAYTELYFTEVYWPDFKRPQLEAALNWFAGRQRRFGLISEQVEQPHA